MAKTIIAAGKEGNYYSPFKIYRVKSISISE